MIEITRFDDILWEAYSQGALVSYRQNRIGIPNEGWWLNLKQDFIEWRKTL